MMKKIFLGLTTVAVTVASAASYNVSLYQDSTVAGKQLKAGDYKIQVKDNNAVIKHNKDVVQVPVRTEENSAKYANTMVRYSKGGEIQEILVGGTSTKIVFNNSAPATANGTR